MPTRITFVKNWGIYFAGENATFADDVAADLIARVGAVLYVEPDHADEPERVVAAPRPEPDALPAPATPADARAAYTAELAAAADEPAPALAASDSPLIPEAVPVRHSKRARR